MSANTEMLEILSGQAAHCTRCRLAGTRTKVVFGEGAPDAEVMFIGEGPGKQEDLSGRPFVGPAGELLTRIIEKGMGVPRAAVYIANIVKCRATVDQAMVRDRAPEADEIESCLPFIAKQVELVQPRVIVSLGSPATRTLLDTRTGITRLRGNWGKFNGVPVMPTYHPSYVLRNGGNQSPLRKDVWADIQQVLTYLGWERPSA